MSREQPLPLAPAEMAVVPYPLDRLPAAKPSRPRKRQCRAHVLAFLDALKSSWPPTPQMRAELKMARQACWACRRCKEMRP